MVFCFDTKIFFDADVRFLKEPQCNVTIVLIGGECADNGKGE